MCTSGKVNHFEFTYKSQIQTTTNRTMPSCRMTRTTPVLPPTSPVGGTTPPVSEGCNDDFAFMTPVVCSGGRDHMDTGSVLRSLIAATEAVGGLPDSFTFSRQPMPRRVALARTASVYRLPDGRIVPRVDLTADEPEATDLYSADVAPVPGVMPEARDEEICVDLNHAFDVAAGFDEDFIDDAPVPGGMEECVMEDNDDSSEEFDDEETDTDDDGGKVCDDTCSEDEAYVAPVMRRQGHKRKRCVEAWMPVGFCLECECKPCDCSCRRVENFIEQDDDDEELNAIRAMIRRHNNK